MPYRVQLRLPLAFNAFTAPASETGVDHDILVFALETLPEVSVMAPDEQSFVRFLAEIINSCVPHGLNVKGIETMETPQEDATVEGAAAPARRELRIID